ncbi:hypothetical protein RHE_CH01799 [Rhizobium etli CFN 42]|uniref:Uncharacterized protein n=1 Tax=Rhizobium etli (strain ATCC 51251 / DSM 11541 / JCM 21823 / NBRC 15573 / CFN 42) TaxID=347834 RepID=Q2K992_RHIEC|nr:hypothetical protein RHE_CH01799 [Rhizobium etli CFN 42]
MLPFRFRRRGDQGARGRYRDDVSWPFKTCPFTCDGAAHVLISQGKLKSQMMAIQQQRRNGGTDVPLVKSDNCVDFFSQCFFCQFLGCLRTHDLDLLQSFQPDFHLPPP